MTTKQNNIFYRSNFDGDIFAYRTKNFLSPIFWLLGFKQTVQTPVNVVLGYRRRKVLSSFTFLELTVNKYSFGQDTPNPICFPPILFFGRRDELLVRLISAMEKSIVQSKHGLNVGLMNVDVNKLREFQSSHLLGIEDHNQGFGSTQSPAEKQPDIGSKIVRLSSVGRHKDSTVDYDNPSLALIVNKEFPRDAGV